MSALRSKLYALVILALAPASAFSFDLFADLLYWKASEQPSLLWASSLGSTLGNIEVFEGENVAFDWDTGFRVGVGHVFECDCWDVQLYYTWFRSHGSKTIPKKDEIIFTQFFAGFLKEDLAESAKIKLSLKYNMFDGQLGRNFCLIERFSQGGFKSLVNPSPFYANHWTKKKTFRRTKQIAQLPIEHIVLDFSSYFCLLIKSETREYASKIF